MKDACYADKLHHNKLSIALTLLENKPDFALAGSDPQFAAAINAFLDRWGAFSAESKPSIFDLFRELIDPAWKNLQISFPDLKTHRMDVAWRRYQERFLSNPIFFSEQFLSFTQRAELARLASLLHIPFHRDRTFRHRDQGFRSS